jgi:hypothetical protein
LAHDALGTRDEFDVHVSRRSQSARIPRSSSVEALIGGGFLAKALLSRLRDAMFIAPEIVHHAEHEAGRVEALGGKAPAEVYKVVKRHRSLSKPFAHPKSYFVRRVTRGRGVKSAAGARHGNGGGLLAWA